MKQIKLLLLENVDNLGIVGDVVKVRPGYARNYLLPRGLAASPTEKAVERLADRRRQVEEQMRQLREQLKALIAKLEGHELTIERSANEQGILYGGVSQHDIAEALRAEGFDVEDRYVRIGEQIKRLDSYEVPIVIDKELKTQVKVWVVSDKPAEQLEAEAESEGASEEEAEVTAELDESEAEAPARG